MNLNEAGSGAKTEFRSVLSAYPCRGNGVMVSYIKFAQFSLFLIFFYGAFIHVYQDVKLDDPMSFETRLNPDNRY